MSMKKIRLDVEELEVSSFAVDAAHERSGTVEAHSPSIYGLEGCDYSLDVGQSCRHECFVYSWEYHGCGESGDSCGASCAWACDSVNIC
jgi:hypothetical protein